MDVFLVRSEMLCARRSSEVQLRERTYLQRPPENLPLLRWIGDELERVRHPSELRRLLWSLESLFGWRTGADRYEYARDEIEEILLPNGSDEPSLRCVASFRGRGRLVHDLGLISALVNQTLGRRLRGEDLEHARFPASLAPESPLRILNFPGWLYFDRAETNEVLDAIRSLRGERADRESLNNPVMAEEDWDDIARGWETGSFDLMLFLWEG